MNRGGRGLAQTNDDGVAGVGRPELPVRRRVGRRLRQTVRGCSRGHKRTNVGGGAPTAAATRRGSVRHSRLPGDRRVDRSQRDRGRGGTRHRRCGRGRGRGAEPLAAAAECRLQPPGCDPRRHARSRGAWDSGAVLTIDGLSQVLKLTKPLRHTTP